MYRFELLYDLTILFWEIDLLDDIHDERFKNEDESPQFEE